MTKTKKIIAWILAGLLALIFTNSGIGKFIGTEIQLKILESFGFPDWARIPFGLVEILFAITILIPRSRKLTIYGIFTWTVIASMILLRAGQASMMIVPIIFSVVGTIILWLQKETKISHQ
jgi:uncharacterized membrane protein